MVIINLCCSLKISVFRIYVENSLIPGSSPRMTILTNCFCLSFPHSLTRIGALSTNSRCIKQRESSMSYTSFNVFANEPKIKDPSQPFCAEQSCRLRPIPS